MKMHGLFYLTILLSYGCSHPIEIVGEGDVMSASGDRDCSYEDFHAGMDNCSKNLVTDAYDETYYALPRAGSKFNGWGNYCLETGIDLAECSFSAPAEVVEDFMFTRFPPLVAYFRKSITDPYYGLFMGHSFFDPFIGGLDTFAGGSGFEGHSGQRVFAGGNGGSAINLWQVDNETTAEAKGFLDEGGLSLVGMTLFGEEREHELQGYRNWIQYALINNPDAAFFIAVPWSLNPGSAGLEQEFASWEDYHISAVHYAIDVLRQEFPGTNIFCVPYGAGAYELRRRLEADNLPGVDTLVKQGDGKGIHVDDLGHADSILVELGSLIWLASIYGVDLNQFDYQTLPRQNFVTAHPDADLAALARQILGTHDHRYDSL
jgi:hypothetical protein